MSTPEHMHQHFFLQAFHAYVIMQWKERSLLVMSCYEFTCIGMLAKMDVFVFIEGVYCSTCFQIAIQVVPLWLLIPPAAMKKRALSAAPRLSGLYSTACSNNGGVQDVHCRLCSTGIIMRKSFTVISDCC